MWPNPPSPRSRGAELLYHVKARAPNNGQHHQLRHPHAVLQNERFVAAVPARHHDLALVVGVDQSYQVAEYYPVLVAKAGARKNDRGQFGIGDMQGDAGMHQAGLARLERQRFLQAGPKVHAGRSLRFIPGEPGLCIEYA